MTTETRNHLLTAPPASTSVIMANIARWRRERASFQAMRFGRVVGEAMDKAVNIKGKAVYGSKRH